MPPRRIQPAFRLRRILAGCGAWQGTCGESTAGGVDRWARSWPTAQSSSESYQIAPGGVTGQLWWSGSSEGAIENSPARKCWDARFYHAISLVWDDRPETDDVLSSLTGLRPPGELSQHSRAGLFSFALRAIAVLETNFRFALEGSAPSLPCMRTPGTDGAVPSRNVLSSRKLFLRDAL